ncbi:hypothetical protein ACLB1T_01950 [Escherichia coli]
MVAPSGEGAVRWDHWRCTALIPQSITWNSHGTSTPVGDVKTAAIREVFGDKSPAISATKAMTGHALGAAAYRKLIYSLLMLEHGFIAPASTLKSWTSRLRV